MGLILGPITYVEINGHDITDHVSNFTFSGVEAVTAPTPAPDWQMLKDECNRSCAAPSSRTSPASLASSTRTATP